MDAMNRRQFNGRACPKLAARSFLLVPMNAENCTYYSNMQLTKKESMEMEAS